MASSGTYLFNPSLGELTLYAFNLAGVRPTALTQEYMFSARMAANLMLIDWANDGPTLWKVDQVQTPLVTTPPQGTYTVDPNVIMILDAYITTDNGLSPPIDRIITPVSRSEYASYPNKEQQGFPTVYWFDRLISPTVTIWPLPVADGIANQFLTYYCVRQIQDANFTSAQTLDVQYRFLNAFAQGLALEMARIWNPQAVQLLAPFAERAYKMATKQDVENANMYVSPMLSSYYRP